MAAVKSVITFCSAVHRSVQLPVWLSLLVHLHTQTDARDRIAWLTDVIVLSVLKSVCIKYSTPVNVNRQVSKTVLCFVLLNGQN